MVRAIFSQRERRILSRWLSKGERLEGFRLIKHKLLKLKAEIDDDIKLYRKVIKRFQEEES